MATRILALLALLFTFPARAGDYDPVAADVRPVSKDFPPAIAELVIESAGERLPGLIYIADGPGPHPTVVLLHGLPGNEKNLDIAQVLRRAGFNVLFFHYRGAWGAEGVYSFTHVVEDVAAVLAFLRNPDIAQKYRVDTRHLTTLGHSLGGYASLAAGARDQGLACVGAMAAANLGVMAAALKSENTTLPDFADYADSLFILRGFDAQSYRAELLSTPMARLDTTAFGGGLRGKSVFLVAGAQDRVTPPALMFEPVVSAYLAEGGIDLHHFQIEGDHAFSQSRIRLARLVLSWLERRCR